MHSDTFNGAQFSTCSSIIFSKFVLQHRNQHQIPKCPFTKALKRKGLGTFKSLVVEGAWRVSLQHDISCLASHQEFPYSNRRNQSIRLGLLHIHEWLLPITTTWKIKRLTTFIVHPPIFPVSPNNYVNRSDHLRVSIIHSLGNLHPRRPKSWSCAWRVSTTEINHRRPLLVVGVNGRLGRFFLQNYLFVRVFLKNHSSLWDLMLHLRSWKRYTATRAADGRFGASYSAAVAPARHRRKGRREPWRHACRCGNCQAPCRSHHPNCKVMWGLLLRKCSRKNSRNQS